ncbi:MAG TPA: AMMECR1 domain-containing protein [Abditibacterium sp.]|jgi:AMMECR1 domain-containing protein
MRFPLLFCFLVFSMASARADDFAAQLQTPSVQKIALDLSRRAVISFLKTGQTIAAPQNLPPALQKRAAVFVTVEKRGQITPRGCRGTLQPISRTLGEEIIRNSIAAASRDKRVAPLKLSELPDCLISLTVVLRVSPLSSLANHDAEKNGLIARRGSQIGIVLPFEGRDSQTHEKWARRKAGLSENARAELLELVAVRFREN